MSCVDIYLAPKHSENLKGWPELDTLAEVEQELGLGGIKFEEAAKKDRPTPVNVRGASLG